MKKLVAALGVAALLSLGYVGASSAQAADSYPDQPLTITMNATVISGSKFKVSAKVADGYKYTFKYQGKSKTFSGGTGSATFTAPTVTKSTRTMMSVTGETGSAPVASSLSNLAVPMASFGPVTQNITVSPDNGSGGALPDTGAGSNTVPLVLVGGALLLAGGGAVLIARRRQNA